MPEETKSAYAPSLSEKVKMWLMVRKKIKMTEEGMRANKLIMCLFRNQQQQLPDNESYKKDHAEIQLKIGQLEAKVLADQRAFEYFTHIDLSDPELYQAVEL